MDFEQWFKDHRYSDTPFCYGAAKDAFKAGQQSKQAEIDALKDKINSALKALEKLDGYDYNEDIDSVFLILGAEQNDT